MAKGKKILKRIGRGAKAIGGIVVMSALVYPKAFRRFDGTVYRLRWVIEKRKDAGAEAEILRKTGHFVRVVPYGWGMFAVYTKKK